MSYKDVSQSMKAIAKYFKTNVAQQPKKTKLDLKSSNVSDASLAELVDSLLEMHEAAPFFLEVEELDLSYNHITDEGCKGLAQLFAANIRIKNLNVGKNMRITIEGFKALTKSMRKNSHIASLDLSLCDIQINKREEFDPIIDDVSTNCSLAKIELHGNFIDSFRFQDLLKAELDQNKMITDIIIPSIKHKEERKQQRLKKKLFERNERRKAKLPGLNINAINPT